MFLPFSSKSKTNKSGKIILQKFDKKRVFKLLNLVRLKNDKIHMLNEILSR